MELSLSTSSVKPGRWRRQAPNALPPSARRKLQLTFSDRSCPQARPEATAAASERQSSHLTLRYSSARDPRLGYEGSAWISAESAGLCGLPCGVWMPMPMGG